jgi:hypothetical protein
MTTESVAVPAFNVNVLSSSIGSAAPPSVMLPNINVAAVEPSLVETIVASVVVISSAAKNV